MRTASVPTPSRHWGALDRRARRPLRFEAREEYLESRQLLSAVQTGVAHDVPTIPPVASAAALTPPVALGAAVSGDLGAAASSRAPGRPNAGQAGSVSNELSNLAASSAGTVATLAAIASNPAVDETGVNLTLTNLAVTWLNPVMTSSTGGIIDTQVDSDAYLVPSTTDQLEEYLGERAAPASEHGSMFSDLGDPGARPVPSIMQPTTTSAVISNPAIPAPVANSGRSHVSNLGQSAPKASSVAPLNSRPDEFVEILEPSFPPEAPQAQPGLPGTQSPASDVAPETVPPAGEAPVPDTAPEAAPQGGQTSAPGITLTRPDPPMSDSGFDAALELIDARVVTRSRDGDHSQPAETLSLADPARCLSVFFAATLLGSGGYHLALHNTNRPRSRGRLILHCPGPEPSIRRKPRRRSADAGDGCRHHPPGNPPGGGL
jgi:hypothetical protein